MLSRFDDSDTFIRQFVCVFRDYDNVIFVASTSNSQEIRRDIRVA